MVIKSNSFNKNVSKLTQSSHENELAPKYYLYYHIHSNKHPGCLDKSTSVRAYLIQNYWKDQPKKWVIKTVFRIIPSNITGGKI